jgi:hypothetical protein
MLGQICLPGCDANEIKDAAFRRRSTAPTLEHFQEKWDPVFRPKMRLTQDAEAVFVSAETKTALDCPRSIGKLG